jgi:hypothetical protein
MLVACGSGRDAGERAAATDTAASGADSAPAATIALTVDSLQAPEAARFDPALGVYFVSNINGEALGKDGNGYISRLTRDGKVDSLKVWQSRATPCGWRTSMPPAPLTSGAASRSPA